MDATIDIKVALRLAGTPIGPNDTTIAGHAIAVGAILVTLNTREFERVRVLRYPLSSLAALQALLKPVPVHIQQPAG